MGREREEDAKPGDLPGRNEKIAFLRGLGNGMIASPPAARVPRSVRRAAQDCAFVTAPSLNEGVFFIF